MSDQEMTPAEALARVRAVAEQYRIETITAPAGWSEADLLASVHEFQRGGILVYSSRVQLTFQDDPPRNADGLKPLGRLWWR